MALLAIVFKALILLAPPVGTFIAIHRTQGYWPIAFSCFVGTAITAINFRVAGQLAELAASNQPPSSGSISPIFHFSAWILCPLLLFFGLRKLYKIRAAKALAELLKLEG